MHTTPQQREAIWMHFTSHSRPRGITTKKLNRIKKTLMMNDEFWADIIFRHGLDRETPDELLKTNKAIYDHCLGNFWATIAVM